MPCLSKHFTYSTETDGDNWMWRYELKLVEQMSKLSGDKYTYNARTKRWYLLGLVGGPGVNFQEILAMNNVNQLLGFSTQEISAGKVNCMNSGGRPIDDPNDRKLANMEKWGKVGNRSLRRAKGYDFDYDLELSKIGARPYYREDVA